MSNRWRHISSAPVTRHLSRLLLLSSLLGLTSLAACSKKNEPEQPTVDEHVAEASKTIVLQTDSTEWAVYLFKEHLLYSDAVAEALPSPWHIPTRDEATVLRTLTYASPSGERFITSDGYTFGMPSASVSKAGSKTQYSVLGLYIRHTTIVMEW